MREEKSFFWFFWLKVIRLSGGWKSHTMHERTHAHTHHTNMRWTHTGSFSHCETRLLAQLGPNPGTLGTVSPPLCQSEPLFFFFKLYLTSLPHKEKKNFTMDWMDTSKAHSGRALLVAHTSCTFNMQRGLLN